MPEKTRVLVTGATGFVGGAVTSRLLGEAGCDVVALARGASRSMAHQPDRAARSWQADITRYDTLAPLQRDERVDVVIHAAGLAHQFGTSDKGRFDHVNVRGTENVCRLAAGMGARQVILVSSVSVYGDQGGLEVEESCACRPVGWYAESKLASERVAIESCDRTGMALTILRLGTVIGEGDRGNVARLVSAIDRGFFVWVGDGTNRKSLIYKGDVAEAAAIALRHESRGISIFNVTADAVPMKFIAGVIAKVLGKRLPRWSLSPRLARVVVRCNQRTFALATITRLGTTVERWLSDEVFSGGRFRQLLGFTPRTTIEQALERQVNHHVAMRGRR